jgi:hypothetical protein
MSGRGSVEAKLLSTLRASGRSRPTQLVDAVVTQSKRSRHDVREALRDLVERQEVALNWRGELEPSHH